MCTRRVSTPVIEGAFVSLPMFYRPNPKRATPGDVYVDMDCCMRRLQGMSRLPAHEQN